MTKAFTSALGYGVTIRGYIDEDDKLVLLEPEGGGGGDFNIANVVVDNTTDGLVSGCMPVLVETDDGKLCTSMGFIDSDSYEVPLYFGTCLIQIAEYQDYTIEVTGDITVAAAGAIIIQGDGTITIGSV